MKRIILSLFLLALAAPAFAQTTASLFDVDKRLSVGARAYRSFDEAVGVSGSYSRGYWAGISAAYEVTSPHDPKVKFPVSAIGAMDVRVSSSKQTFRGYIGLAMQLKRAAQ